MPPQVKRRLPPGCFARVTTLLGTTLWLGSTAHAATEPKADKPKPAKSSDGPPAATTGFQMALGTGVSFPFGDASNEPGDTLEQRYSYQIPILLELGGKPDEHVYVGGYFGLGFGAEGDDALVEGYCDDDDGNGENDISCTAVQFTLGAEIRYGFSPAARWNPWLSYGAGFEGTNLSFRDSEQAYSEDTLASGYTYGKLGFGADYRGGSAGLSPTLHLAFGRYESSSTRANGELEFRGPLSNPAWHMWLTLALKVVWNP